MLSFSQMKDHKQSFFASEEVLYGGSAGGGKSYAMLADPLRYMGHPSFSGLLCVTPLRNYESLYLKAKNCTKNMDGIEWSERKMQWVAPSGARLWMSYLDRDDDVLRYQGLAFSWIGLTNLHMVFTICLELHEITIKIYITRSASVHEATTNPR